MEVDALDVQAYLARISYRGSLAPSAEALRQLHVAHLLTVPFENLSIHYGERIVLDERALFDKLVRRRRGGFCYELNGLFAALLRALGFNVTMLSARVISEVGEASPEFDHLVLLVHLEQNWLADVGFGDLFREPLLLEQRLEQIQGENAFRLDVHEDRFTVLRSEKQGLWKGQYRFGFKAHILDDFAARCRYHQTDPTSHFKQGRICTRATPDGRLTLSERRLITTAASDRQEREIASEMEYSEVLRGLFGIVLNH